LSNNYTKNGRKILCWLKNYLDILFILTPIHIYYIFYENSKAVHNPVILSLFYGISMMNKEESNCRGFTDHVLREMGKVESVIHDYMHLTRPLV
jgi:hypothetical protein